ncbi:DUF3348 domain-containing protein [Pusillimonas sp. MFBS29]|uniref:DUF3348 domain-containing protein n=1 Tax=Pusillimonas sp. MFBS29 TaxID=2886690 RepID=UPI001D1037A3|nr:DUF3348 domain-containing protein [Pusillimonas sp. MFBS29]MCC2597648.1 DUF3348 domain-containing protein [Pusillimonas sp. MFBS29]
MARRTSFSGPALVRLLAHWNDARIREPSQSLSDRLSQWLGWSDAIALAGALGGAVPAGSPMTPSASRTTRSPDYDQEYERVRNALVDLIDNVNKPPPVRHRHRQAPAARPDNPVQTESIEFSTYRQRYITLQQTMEARCSELRTRLRARLAGMSPEMARLAAVDAVMEQALNEREFSVLARVPVVLEAHFRRLKHEAAPLPAAESGQESATTANAWLNVFHQDMQSVLFAELEIRLQPTQGLLAALTRRP